MKNNERWQLSLWAVFMLISCNLNSKPQEENLRLVVTAGLSHEDPFRAFYQSLIFSGTDSPLVIEKIFALYETKNAVFYSEDSLTPAEMVKAHETFKKYQIQGILGQSYRGFPLGDDIPLEVTRSLGAASHTVACEWRMLNDKVILGFSKTSQGVIWPKDAAELKLMPGALIKDSDSSFKALVSARSVGALANKLGLVDELLKHKHARFVDLGSEHVSGDFSLNSLKEINKRNPLALFLGRAEMSFMLQNGVTPAESMIYPFKDHAHVTSSGIDLWSAVGNEKWPLYSTLGTLNTVKDSLSAMKKLNADPSRHLNIVRVFSKEAALAAAKSVEVDLVLMVSDSPFAKLPEKEVIDLKNSKSDAYEQLAPIVELSYSDVATISLFGSTLGSIERLEIDRHSVSDEAPKAFIAEPSVLAFGLPEGEWRKEDFKRILGGVMVKATKADIAIFQPVPEISVIKGAVPFSLLNNLLNPGGGVAMISLSGAQVKNIARMVKNGDLDLEIHGMDVKSGAIGKRSISDKEQVNVAVSEKALVDLYLMAGVGAFNETYSVRAPFVEGIYGNVNQLFFAGGPKTITTADSKVAIDLAFKELPKLSFNDIFQEFFVAENGPAITEFIKNPQGLPHHVITLDIAYLDIGISSNVANDTYKKREKDKDNPFPLSRGKIPVLAHLYGFAKVDLTYDAPKLITKLLADVKFMQTNFEKKPERDKAKLILRFRLPWERSFFEGSSIVVSPILQEEYETQIVPNFWSKPAELVGPRTKALDSLLGFNVDFKNLGFNTDLGGLFAINFNRSSSTNAIDIGPAVNVVGKWSIYGPLELSTDIKSYYLFPLPKNTANNKVALGVEGTAWLRVARFYDFSVSLVSDFLVATLQEAPKEFSLSSIFGLTISYGHLFRLFG